MWILLITTALLSTVHAQQQSQCVQQFDQGIRKCLNDFGRFQLEVMFSLVTNGTSGPLPQGANRADLSRVACANRESIGQCITPLPTNPNPTCTQRDVGMMRSTIGSMGQGLAALCGQAPTPPVCLKKFDEGFRNCLTKVQVVPDQFFMFLANKTMPPGVNREQVKQKSCSDTAKASLMTCSTEVVTGIQGQGVCNPQETIMVGTTLQNMLGRYEAVCTGKTTSADQCMAKFQEGMDKCAQRTLNMPMQSVLMVLNNQTGPGQDAAALKKTICASWKNTQNCGKNVVANSGCARMQLLTVEATFANMMITTATFCGDTSLPGACLLTLQKQFGECFGKVGLNPKIYLSNSTEHKGALIGANKEEADVYCSKKHDLFTCMQEVMHGCPGAEQTLQLTGFDLHAMERAVGLLCHDIPDYLDGLRCFEKPSDAARQCMEDMTNAITTLSTRQITQQLSMDNFFNEFCDARVNHVNCDSNAWAGCRKNAVDLKNQFECELIPTRCYSSHRANIDTVCPNTEARMPDKKPPSKVPDCALNIAQNMNQCFQSHNLEPDMFLVNITHDRRNFLGDANKAKSLCSSRKAVFKCMKNIIKDCPASANVLAYWGHEQNALERSINLICNDLPLYTKGLQCFSNANVRIQQCVAMTNQKMMKLTDLQLTKDMSPDSYFRQFCSIRVEHLTCDLAAWKSTCADDVIGLKTEFECKLVQEQCKNLQVANFKTACNPITYASQLRGGTSGGLGGTNNGGGNGSSPILASMAAILSTTILSLLVFLL